MPSRPGEFHPEPLTDPDLNLSIHPARVTARRLPPSAEPSGSSRFDPVGPCSTAMTCPLCSTGITPLHHYYGAVRPSPAHRYFRPHGWTRLCLSLSIAGQVLTFHTRARLSFAPPTCRMPLGQSQCIPQADPGRRVNPRFWHRLIRFRHFIDGSLALASLNRACRDHVPTFPQRSPPSLLTTAACGGLRSTPDCRPRRALLHLSYSCAWPFGPTAPKRLELLHELLPTQQIVGLLINPTNPLSGPVVAGVQTAASSLGVQLPVLHARTA